MAMGVIDSLKGVYFSLEDKYYALMDAIDVHLPVYKIIEPIDKVFPSFMLFCVLAILLLGAIYVSFFGNLLAGTAKFGAIVTNEDGTLISNAEITISYGNESTKITTDTFGKTETIILPKTTLSLKVQAENYDAFEQTYELVSDNNNFEIELKAMAGAGTERTIKLLNEAGQPIVGEVFSLSFSCTNRTAIAPEDATTTTGEAIVIEPLNCSGLIVSVSSKNYAQKDSFPIVQDIANIYLDEKNIGKGTLKVNVLFNNKPVEDGISVQLFVEGSVGPIEQKGTQNGFVSFTDIESGEYTVKTKATTKYGVAEKEDVLVAPDDEKNITLDLEQNIVGKIKIKVVDKGNGLPIAGAHVTLRLGNDIVGEEDTSLDENAIVEFPVSENAKYIATADQNEYCFGTLTNIPVADGLNVLQLTKFTGSCGGALKVKVLDQDAKIVRNAIVSIANEQGYFIGLSEKTTDINGVATFNGVPSGTFKAFAYKSTSSGWSDAKYFNRRGTAATEPDLVVTMVVPDGTVQVAALDRENKPVPFATVYFYDSFNNQLIGGGAIPADSNGIASIVTRADKEVFVVVEAQNFASYKSIAVQVSGGSAQLIEARMLPKQNKFEVELLGLYTSGYSASTLASNTEYKAKFRIKIPDELKNNAHELGLHVRVGTEQISEKDLLFIKATNAPKASIIKGTSFTGNYSEDIASISSNDAKWANFVWTKVDASVTDIEATIKIKETAALGKKLDIYYRAWEENSALQRDPPTDYLAGDDLYANTKVATFQVGTGTLCDEKFCFDATITDKQQSLTTAVIESYQSKIFNQYSLAFTISNASKFDTDTIRNAELRIKNAEGNLLFRAYSIVDAANKPLEGTVNSSEFQRIDVGNLAPTRKVSGSFEFVPQNSMDGIIHFEIVDKDLGIVAFAKDISISVSADNELAVTVNPTVLPSGIENEIIVNVKDSTTSVEIEKATVRIKDKFGSTIVSKETNKRGNASLIIPSQSPGEKLKLLVEKPGYNLIEKEISVNPDVLEITPNQIGLAMNPKTITSAEKQLKLKNLVAFPLTVSKIEFTGKTGKLLDTDAMNNALRIYEGTEIKTNDDTAIVFKAILSDAGKNLTSRTDIIGTLSIESNSFGQTWLNTLPVKISIGLGGEVSDPTCLTITKQEWKAATEGKPIVLELQLENNCVIENEPIALTNLEVKIDWQTNKLGEFDLMTENSATTLRSGYFKTIRNRIEKEQTINMQINFSPAGGVNGVGKAKIVFQATNPTEAKSQVLSAELSTEISVVNLVDCISFSKEDIEMQLPNTTSGEGVPTGGETSDSFTIKTVKCGAPVQIKLESELDVSNKEFTLQADDSKDIKVSASGALPGKYGIQVRVEGASARTAKQIKNIEVLILPAADNCIRLSRYEFDVYDDPSDPYDGADSVKIYNECPDKTVDVTVDMHSWTDAMQQGALWAVAGLAIGAVSQYFQGNTIWGGQKGSGTYLQGGPDYSKLNWSTVNQQSTDAGNNTTTSQIGYYSKVGDNTYFKNNSGAIWVSEKNGPWKQVEGTAGQTIPTINPAMITTTQPATAKVVLPLTGRATAPAAAGGLGGTDLLSGLGNGLGSLGNLISSGNPLTLGILGFLTGTLTAYNSQGEKALSFTAKDVEIGNNIGLFMNKDATAKDKDIITEVISTETIEPKKGTEYLSVKTKEVIFRNKTAIVQDDALNPLYRFLRVDGNRHVYSANQDYKNKVPNKDHLNQDKAQQILEKFHLQFNSYRFCTDGNCFETSNELRNCQLGSRIGSTGERALPKIKLAWDWSSIGMNECDEGNPNYIYCDATQFSIELLKKTELVRQFVEDNAPFECPSLVSGVDPVNQSLSTIDFDSGITKLEILKATSDINAVATIESNNKKQMTVQITFTLTNNDTNAVQNCSQTTGLMSKSIVGCSFKGLVAGNYTARAIITNTTGCSDCLNSSSLNDKAAKTFNIGAERELVKCEPFATMEGSQNRLEKFIIASEQAGRSLQYPAGIASGDEMAKLVKFKAYLIKDGYSTDFRKDFHDFALTRSFFDTPEFYKNPQTGLGEYFSNEKAMSFDYFGAPAGPINAPGVYDVSIDINFADSGMNFFKDNEPIAKIIVHMEKTKDAKPASPFYYLPFDGTIGEETGRIGYGLNYLLKSPDKIVKINNSTTQPVRVRDLPGSNPTFTLNGAFADDFRTLNQTKRGILLDVDLSRDLLTISPSKATPLILKVSSDKSEDAYGYYALEIDKEPQATSSYLTKWTGIGMQCIDFAGNNMEKFRENADLHGIESKCARLGTNELTSYGLEWCNKKFSGNVFLQGIIFTPQEKNSRLFKVAAAEKMELITLNSTGETVELTGFNSNPTINSVEDVLELVRAEKVCITGYDNSNQTEFFWNPKFVLDQLSQQAALAEQQCARAS